MRLESFTKRTQIMTYKCKHTAGPPTHDLEPNCFDQLTSLPFLPFVPPPPLFDSAGIPRCFIMLIISRNGTRGDRARPEEILKRKVRVPHTAHLVSHIWFRRLVVVFLKVWSWYVVCK